MASVKEAAPLLNPLLDPDRLAESYAQRSRLQICDILTEPFAERILDILQTRTPWGIAYNQGAKVFQLDAAQLAALTPQQQQQILAGVNQGAREGFQFLYALYPLFAEYFRPGAARHPLFEVYEFLNSATFLAFIRRVTGVPDIRWADAQATIYQAGHFLKYHTDETPSQKRLVAYVLNLTKDWGRDWGGFLQFFDENYNVEQALRPIFNAINLFTIPAHHSVSMVATYAPRGRISITGWFRGDDPPGVIGGR